METQGLACDNIHIFNAKVCSLVHIFITHYSLIPLYHAFTKYSLPNPGAPVDIDYKKSMSSETDKKNPQKQLKTGKAGPGTGCFAAFQHQTVTKPTRNLSGPELNTCNTGTFLRRKKG